MACFLVPTALGILTAAFKKRLPKEWHFNWLNAMLWGGVAMLAVEHVAHKEVVLWPPFLTAMNDPSEVPVMLEEMATIGGAMTIVIVCAWLGMVLVAHRLAREKTISGLQQV
jgi:hypothetical protein